MADAPSRRAFIVRPCSPERAEQDTSAGRARLARLGWSPVDPGPVCREPLPFLAGPDAERAASLDRALAAATDMDAVWAMRGGTGSLGTLDQWGDPAANPRVPLLGLSDVTALLIARFRRGGRAIHAPGVAQLGVVDEASVRALDALLGRDPTAPETTLVAPEVHTLVPGRARGRLIGGNLSVLAALAGSAELDWGPGPWLLMLEDTGEPPFRVHRLLWQLRAAGVFGQAGVGAAASDGASDGVVGLVFGTFDAAPPAETLACLRHHAQALGLPACASLPFGHTSACLPFELGAWASFDAERGALTMVRDP